MAAATLEKEAIVANATTDAPQPRTASNTQSSTDAKHPLESNFTTEMILGVMNGPRKHALIKSNQKRHALDLSGLKPNQFTLHLHASNRHVEIESHLVGGVLHKLRLLLSPMESDDRTTLVNVPILPVNTNSSGTVFEDCNGGFWSMDDGGRPLNPKRIKPLTGKVTVDRFEVRFLENSGDVASWRHLQEAPYQPIEDPSNMFNEGDRLFVTGVMNRRHYPLVTPSKNFASALDISQLLPKNIRVRSDLNTPDMRMTFGIEFGNLQSLIRCTFGAFLPNTDFSAGNYRTQLSNFTLDVTIHDEDSLRFSDSTGGNWTHDQGRPLMASGKITGSLRGDHGGAYFNEGNIESATSDECESCWRLESAVDYQ